jgi:hypothetical protein
MMAYVNLERLTEPFELFEYDEACGEGREDLVDVGASFVADGQSAEAVEPGMGTLDDPPG